MSVKRRSNEPPFSEFMGSPYIHPDMYLMSHRDYLGAATFVSWLGLSTFLVSFAVVINNTANGGEPAAATFMAALGFLLTIWCSVLFFRANWDIQYRPSMIGLMFLVILFLAVTIWLIIRIWVKRQ